MKDPVVSQVTISGEDEGQRLDNFLLKWAKGVPKSHIYRIIRSGEVRVNKKRAEVTTRILSGDIIRIPPMRVALPENGDKTAENTPKAIKISDNLPILYEDDCLLIVNKPSGLAVHGGSGVSLGLIEALRLARPQLKFLELVHRLDRDTSGILMLAKKRSALVTLHEDIRLGHLDKRYTFVAHGMLPQDGKHIALKYPLHKYLLPNGERRVQVSENGQESHTVIKVIKQWPEKDIFMAQAQLKTGRTHQIRVHLQHHGYPILGDDKYGVSVKDKKLGVKRLMLHAHRLSLLHPFTQEKMIIESSLPEEFTN